MSTATFAPAPFDLQEVLGAEWLTIALSARFPGVRVVGVDVISTDSRVSTNVRIRVTYADPVPDGLSRDLCIKGYFTEEGRYFGLLAHPETGFYAEVRDRSDLRTLRAVYAAYDPTIGHGILITEDVAVGGADFLDALSPYTVDQVADSLEQYAVLHASAWGDPELARMDFLAPRQSLYLGTRTADDIAGNFDGPIGDGVPLEVRDPHHLRAAYAALAEIVESGDLPTVVHGDAHVGNIYLDDAARPSLVDWQLVQRGPWYLDVGYHVASALSVDDRREHEDALLSHYLEALASRGAPAPCSAEAKPMLARGVLSGFYLWSITLKVDPRVTTEMLRRLGTAAADHHAFQSVPRI